MSKLCRINTPETDRLIGYLDAAQHAFIKGQYDVRLEAICFDIVDARIKILPCGAGWMLIARAR